MPGYAPPRPTGNDKQARFMQAVWDYIWGGQARVNEVAGSRVNRTTRGVNVITKPVAGGGGAADPVWL